MEVKEIERFSIEAKRVGDEREGDFWISMGKGGCGCCEDSYFELKSRLDSLSMLKQWIMKKEIELKELREKWKNLNES